MFSANQRYMSSLYQMLLLIAELGAEGLALVLSLHGG